MNEINFQEPTMRNLGTKTNSNLKHYIECKYKNDNKTYYLQRDGTISLTCTNGWFDTKEQADKAINDYNKINNKQEK